MPNYNCSSVLPQIGMGASCSCGPNSYPVAPSGVVESGLTGHFSSWSSSQRTQLRNACCNATCDAFCASQPAACVEGGSMLMGDSPLTGSDSVIRKPPTRPTTRGASGMRNASGRCSCETRMDDKNKCCATCGFSVTATCADTGTEYTSCSGISFEDAGTIAGANCGDGGVANLEYNSPQAMKMKKASGDCSCGEVEKRLRRLNCCPSCPYTSTAHCVNGGKRSACGSSYAESSELAGSGCTELGGVAFIQNNVGQMQTLRSTTQGGMKQATGRPPAPKGFHYMPDGSLMRDEDHKGFRNQATRSRFSTYWGGLKIK